MTGAEAGAAVGAAEEDELAAAASAAAAAAAAAFVALALTANGEFLGARRRLEPCISPGMMQRWADSLCDPWPHFSQ